MIELRYITPDDWELWRDQRLAALKEAPYAFGSRFSDWENASKERWCKRLSIPGACQLIAFLHGAPVGMAGSLRADDEPGTAVLVSMWVSPAERGNGVGDALVGAIEKWARDNGAARLLLEVVDSNHAARNLYRRNGFVDVDDPRPSESEERSMIKELY